MKTLPLLFTLVLVLFAASSFDHLKIEKTILPDSANTISMDVCELPPDEGPCDAAIPRYYYNPSIWMCERFIYGGCGGNANNYNTFEECMAVCGNDCDLPPNPGPCDAAFERWYYDSSTGHCETFTYGGCGGNANRYLSKALCMESCGDVCYLPAVVGPCDGAIPRYFFNPNAGDCEMFIYGGCNGNGNNYESYAECMNSCADICDMPADSGDCQAAIPRYYFNKNSGNCQLFTYGGCGGNQNNFITLSACQAACPCTDIVEDDNLYDYQMTVSKSASQHLRSTAILRGNSSVQYSSTDFIELLPGFKLLEQASLDVVLNGCIQ